MTQKNPNPSKKDDVRREGNPDLARTQDYKAGNLNEGDLGENDVDDEKNAEKNEPRAKDRETEQTAM